MMSHAAKFPQKRGFLFFPGFFLLIVLLVSGGTGRSGLLAAQSPASAGPASQPAPLLADGIALVPAPASDGLDPGFDPRLPGREALFVRRDGGHLVLDGKAFRFISFNIPNYHVVEDAASPGSPAWHRVTAFEQLDAARTIRRLGGRVFRIYVPSVQGGANPSPGLVHVSRTADGKLVFNEDLMKDLDRGLAIAASQGLRVIIPLVDNWQWFGGCAEWAAMAGANDFWDDGASRTLFTAFLEKLLSRVNTLTGLAYRDDPTILCWELGNELDKASPDWIAWMASFLKSRDKNHLVMDGSHRSIPDSNLDDPNLDILTTHYGDNEIADWAMWAADSKKAYIYGEFQPRTPAQTREICNTLIDSPASGGMAWSLRFHSSSGGFYFHDDFGQESDSFQYPGFISTRPVDEAGIFKVLRESAWKIRGLSPPAEPVPDAPLLLAPVASGSPAWGISWQGSAGAAWYRLETAATREGPWKTLADHLGDAGVDRRSKNPLPRLPLFTLAKSAPAWYRLIGVNDSGSSLPSPAMQF